jgi:hypothetical protein
MIRSVTTNFVTYCWIGGHTTEPGRTADTGWYPVVTDRITGSYDERSYDDLSGCIPARWLGTRL